MEEISQERLFAELIELRDLQELMGQERPEEIPMHRLMTLMGGGDNWRTTISHALCELIIGGFVTYVRQGNREEVIILN